MQPRKEVIQTGILIAERLRFHTDSVVGKNFTSSYYSKYLSYVSSFIEDEEKRKRFKSFLDNPPFPTVEITEKIWRKRDRIFYAADPYENIEFTDIELKDAANEYLDEIQFNHSFIKELNEYRKTSPNSFWVVDMPNVVTGRPEPYFYIQDINFVIDYVDTPKGLKHVIIKDKCYYEDMPNGRILAIDAKNYIVIPLNEKHEPIFEQAITIVHGLNKTPAGQLSRQSLLKQDYQVKTNIVVNQLGALDTFLFAKISKKYLDSYMFPIIEKIEEECNYRDSDGTECEGGYLHIRCIDEEENEYFEQKECPDCKARRIIGAGSVIVKAAPDAETPMVNDAVKFVTPPVDYLNYSNLSIKEMEETIIKNSVGEVIGSSQSQNELQIEAGFENRKDILLAESEEMSLIKNNIVKCILQFRYSGQFKNSSISLGKEFYLYTVADLEARKKMLLENGASQTELMQLQEKIIGTEYNNNPTVKERLLMLLHLEPLPLLNIEQANNILQSGNLSKEDFEKKIKFDKLVRRFEREQGDIINFLVDAPMMNRINIIDNIINGYLEDEREKNDVGQQRPQQNQANEQPIE